MTNLRLAAGSVWRLHRGDEEIARLIVTAADFPWVHADLEPLPGYEEFRRLFADQELALEADDEEQIEACYEQIRSSLTMTYPDGEPVPEFMLHIHDDGTAGWRWHYEPFEEEEPED